MRRSVGCSSTKMGELQHWWWPIAYSCIQRTNTFMEMKSLKAWWRCLKPTPLLLNTLKYGSRLAIRWVDSRRTRRKLDVPKGNWDWGVGGENWPLPSDEYWDGESWFRRFEKNLGGGSIGRLCSRVDLRCWELSNKLQVWVRRGSKQASEDEANALQFCRGASRHVKRRSTASFLS